MRKIFDKVRDLFRKPAPVVPDRVPGAPNPEGGEEFPFEYIFAPREQFEWVQGERTIGQYVPGNTYNVTRYPVHAALRQKAHQWFAEGKIEIFPLGAGVRFVMTRPTGV